MFDVFLHQFSIQTAIASPKRNYTKPVLDFYWMACCF